MSGKRNKLLIALIIIFGFSALLPQKAKALMLPEVTIEPSKDIITDTNALLHAKVINRSGDTVKEIGIILYQDQTELKHYKQNIDKSDKEFDICFNIQNDIGLTLSAATSYQYKIYFLTSSFPIEFHDEGSFTTEKELQDRQTSATVSIKSILTGALLETELITGLQVSDFFTYEPKSPRQIGDNPEDTYLYDWGSSANQVEIEILRKDPEYNQLVVYYFPEKPDITTTALVCFRDVDTDIVFKTEVLEGLRAGGSLTYVPEETFAAEYGTTYWYDSQDERNDLRCPELKEREQADQNVITVYYSPLKKKGDPTSLTVYYTDLDTREVLRRETLQNLKVGESFTYKPLRSFTTAERVTYDFADDYAGQFLYRPLLLQQAKYNTLNAFYRKRKEPKINLSKAAVKVGRTVYNEKSQKPKVTVACDGKRLIKGQDYTVSYKNAKKIGKASAVIMGIGNYTGRKTASYLIHPQASKILSLSRQKNSRLTVKLRKVKGAGGYEISYADNKKFRQAKKKSVKGTVCILDGLKGGKTYFVRVRAYKAVDGKKIFSAYSAWKRK